jgi:FAD/FMN-containing dehydrogenase
MPTTREIDVYQFDELSDDAKEKAREWYRRASADDTFWQETVLDDAGIILRKLGYCDPKIMFTGFWSQGDGACFTGSWYSSDCKPDALKEYAPVDAELTRIADAMGALIAAHPGMSASITHWGHYYHEMSVSIECNFEYDDETGGDQPNMTADAEAEETFTELSRDLMRWIYRTLEKEWDWQNADEQVDENIRCNEYEFDVDGKRI